MLASVLNGIGVLVNGTVVLLGHIRRRMIDFTGQNAVFVMLSALLNRFLPFIGVWIANLISSALMARLSRRDEFEADADRAGLVLEQRYSTWTLRPPAADFLVAVLAVRPH